MSAGSNPLQVSNPWLIGNSGLLGTGQVPSLGTWGGGTSYGSTGGFSPAWGPSGFNPYYPYGGTPSVPSAPTITPGMGPDLSGLLPYNYSVPGGGTSTGGQTYSGPALTDLIETFAGGGGGRPFPRTMSMDGHADVLSAMRGGVGRPDSGSGPGSTPTTSAGTGVPLQGGLTVGGYLTGGPSLFTTGYPGMANPTGSNAQVPGGWQNIGSTSIGGASNPFLFSYPQGQTSMTTGTVPGFPANTGGMTTTTSFPSPGGSLTGIDLAHGFKKMGYPTDVAKALASFLGSGAGFNPQVASAMIAAMQPQIARGEADIMEAFSVMGNRFGSPAAIGLGDYLSQVQLNEGQLLAGMYEQSVQNYLNALLGFTGKGTLQDKSSFPFGSAIGAAGDILGSLIPFF